MNINNVLTLARSSLATCTGSFSGNTLLDPELEPEPDPESDPEPDPEPEESMQQESLIQ